jgi:hypothetical protein
MFHAVAHKSTHLALASGEQSPPEQEKRADHDQKQAIGGPRQPSAQPIHS